MKKTYIICGLFILGIAAAGVIGNINKIKVIQFGNEVGMEIIEKPNSCIGTKVKWFMKVEHKGKIFSKQISGSYCQEHRVGDKIDMIYLEGEETVLFPDESISSQVFANAVMVIIGFASVIYGLIKK